MQRGKISLMQRSHIIQLTACYTLVNKKEKKRKSYSNRTQHEHCHLLATSPQSVTWKTWDNIWALQRTLKDNKLSLHYAKRKSEWCHSAFNLWEYQLKCFCQLQLQVRNCPACTSQISQQEWSATTQEQLHLSPCRTILLLHCNRNTNQWYWGQPTFLWHWDLHLSPPPGK